MSFSEIRRTHTDLMDGHQEIKAQFTGLGDEFMADFLGDYDTSELRSQVSEHGDGYTLRSVPSSIDEMVSVTANDDLVLIVARYPSLGEESEFDPHENLANISYWREYTRLRQDVGHSRKLHFWVWQGYCPVHGKGLSKARTNMDLLLKIRPQLGQLIPKQKRISEQLLTACKRWLASQDMKLTVITHNNPNEELDSVILRLIGDKSTAHKSTNIYRPNNIMDLLT